MASETFEGDMADATGNGALAELRDVVVMLLTPLASLKFTVVLFVLSIFLVFAGTLAQVGADIHTVMNDYFRSPLVLIELKVFFPPSFFPPTQFPALVNLPGSFPFPGGQTIGGLLALNLLAAHGLRFKSQARGTRLWIGLPTMALGAVATGMVIASGNNSEGMQGMPWLDWDAMWVLFEIGLALLCGAIGYAAARTERRRTIERWSLITLCGLLGVFLVWLVSQGEGAKISDSSMRISWQLIKATTAALVLLAGCIAVFKKRGGIVLLHAGVGLIMFNELYVFLTNVEAQIQIEEGQTVNFAQDIREVELAVIDRSGGQQDVVTVIPEAMLTKAGRRIKDERLPFDVQVARYMENSKLLDATLGKDNPADAGFGRQVKAVEARSGTGTDTNSEVDVAALYVKLTGKDGQPLGNYLMRQFMLDQQVTVGGKPYDVTLRFKRIYKPYSFHLFDVRKDDYVGTSTPRNYSSELHLVDTSRNVDRPDIKIWMNNPLRYAGETFYQSNWAVNPATRKEVTTLSVVTNAGWMIPYVGCMIVVVGMLAQFYVTLVRFLNRRRAAPVEAVEQSGKPPIVKPQRRRRAGRAAVHDASSEGDVASWLVPLVIVTLAAAYLAVRAQPPHADDGQVDLYAFGQLPVAYKGRVLPLDSLARNTMRIISDKETFSGRMDGATLLEEWPKIKENIQDEWPEATDAVLAGFDKEPDVDKLIDAIVAATGEERYDVQEEVETLVLDKLPAIHWLVDVMTDSPELYDHRVFRVANGEVRDLLKLRRRKGMRYSVDELSENIAEFENQVSRARDMEPEEWGLYERKLMELSNRIHAFTLLRVAFRRPPLPDLPSLEEFRNDRPAYMAKLDDFRIAYIEFGRRLRAMEPPRLVPVEPAAEETGDESSDTWTTYSEAWAEAVIATQILGQNPPPDVASLDRILIAYAQRDVKTFNREVSAYHARLASDPPDEMAPAKVDFEARFNHLSPFTYAAFLYVLALVLTAASWLGWTRPLGRSAFWLIVFTLVIHSAALVGRMYISGRPPVTNLYSSAVFIGWALVVAGLGLEVVYRLGVGNLVASVAGFLTLLIAHWLSFDGDTLFVLQAVLDTQFWLTTHVVCVTLGYAATFAAGLLGIIYIAGGLISSFRRALSGNAQGFDHSELGEQLPRMIYGTICFAIFFSFFGTVLGGLWADDSWGRFWGWDPKENGALIIVIWNALVLHARWGRMVKDRGLAALAVGGNIATAWSWFGVNELGIGLHSYGFTDGVLLALTLFIVSQLPVIAAGALPLRLWSAPQPSRSEESTA